TQEIVGCGLISQNQGMCYQGGVVTDPIGSLLRDEDRYQTRYRRGHDRVDHRLIGRSVERESEAIRCDDLGCFVGRLLRLAGHAVLVGSMPGSLWTRWRLVVDRLGVRVVGSRPQLATIRLYSRCLGSSGCRLGAVM